MPLTPSQRLGSYEIVSSLGVGGMGEVYRARDLKLGREVALKVLPPDVTNEAGRLERFDREARAIAALNHPHIVTIFSTEESDGIRFLTMELVEGCTLTDLVISTGMAVPRFLEIAIPLADALAAAHQKQITHRDLKPGNVMVSNDGRVKVLDFGLARVGGADHGEQTLIETIAPITLQGMIVGTMPYMSPEQVEGRAIDARSDLFSLGVIFYELLSGQRPFKGGSSPALMSAILRDTPPALAEQRSDVPAALDRLIGRLIEKRVEDRVQTARDVFNELKHVRKQMESGQGANGRLSVSSIAVLPFADLSEKKDQDWFCDGIAEEIMTALAPLPGLRVAARASAFSFRGKADDLSVIADKLHVGTVLEGSVRRSGDRVRITTQLSDAKLGTVMWSERFDRELKDIFDIQDEIARAIADRLRLTLANTGERLVPRTTINIEAYELLLRGRVLLTRRGRAIADAIPLFERAVVLDPNLAEAHALLGDAYRLLGLYAIAPANIVMPKAQAAVNRALAIDPNQIEALSTAAIIEAIYHWNLPQSVRLSDRALAVEPNHVRTLAERAIAEASFDQPGTEWHRGVLATVAKARSLDPLNAWAVALEAFVQTMVGLQDAAIANARHGIELDANNFTAHWVHCSALAACGRDDEALAAAAPALAMSGRHPAILALIAAVHSRREEIHLAGAIRVELEERATSGFISNALRATVAAAASAWPDARALLARAIDERDPQIAFWKMPAWQATIFKDAECVAMLKATTLFTRASS